MGRSRAAAGVVRVGSAVVIAGAREGIHLGTNTTSARLERRGLALLGDARGVRRAVLEAERHYERSRPDDEPPWSSFYTEAALAVDLGRCFHNLGEPAQAIKLGTVALHDYEPWRVRGRCFVQIDLADTHLLGQDLEQAAAFGRDALRTVADLSSHCTLDRLRTLQRQVRPPRSASPHLAELDERITDFLTRITRRHQQDNDR